MMFLGVTNKKNWFSFPPILILARSKILFYIKICNHVIADQVLLFEFLNTFCITQYIIYSTKKYHIYSYTYIHIKLHLNDLINQNFMINKNAFSFFHLVDIGWIL